MYNITTKLEFSYGHRLLNYPGRCCHLHGHNAFVEVTLESKDLNDMGMVEDSRSVRKILKDWIEENIDHKMLLNRKDPVVQTLLNAGEVLYLMDENPTAENIARLIHAEISKKLPPVIEVKVWETSNCCASYRDSE